MIRPMLLVIIVGLQIVVTGVSATATATAHGTSSYLPLPKVDILVSRSSKLTLFSCFFADDKNEGALRSEKEACCNGVDEAWQDISEKYKDDDDEKKDISSAVQVFYRRCLLEIAQVPSVIKYLYDRKETITPSAKFSWIISNSLASQSTRLPKMSTPLDQYLWTNQTHDRQGDNVNELQLKLQTIHTISPYHKVTVQSSMSMSNGTRVHVPLIAVTEQNSFLGREGGMHRLFHHSFQPVVSLPDDVDMTKTSIYLLVNIPQGMFIDLDDPFEVKAANFKTIESTPISGNTDNINISATSTFVVTNRPTNAHKSSVLSFRAQLHSAIICDIEQPAFVSGQHVLVWEIDNIVITKNQNQQEIGDLSSIPSPVIEFATKLHLRYPHPSSILEEWIDLLKPILFSILPSDYMIIKESDVTSMGIMPGKQQHDWDLDFVERVWVAAGNGDDHGYVMGMTIFFCLIGVVIMLRDISRASLWDNE